MQPVGADPETWLERHGDVLFAFAMVRLRDPAQAEDAVQETLLAALQGRDRFGGGSSERTWLIGILKHKIADQFRRAVRETPTDLSSESAFEHDEFFRRTGEWVGHWEPTLAPIEWNETPSDPVEKAQLWKVVEGCIGQLPTRLAAAFTLREFDDIDTAEICDSLGVTTNNLWVMLHRARIHVRACVEQNWFEPKAPRH